MRLLTKDNRLVSISHVESQHKCLCILMQSGRALVQASVPKAYQLEDGHDQHQSTVLPVLVVVRGVLMLHTKVTLCVCTLLQMHCCGAPIIFLPAYAYVMSTRYKKSFLICDAVDCLKTVAMMLLLLVLHSSVQARSVASKCQV